MRNEHIWKRSIRKRLLAEGREHISSRNKIRPSRITGNNCFYKYKFSEKIAEEKRNVLSQNFNKIGSKDKQDIYFVGFLKRKSINLKRSKGFRKKSSIKYRIRVGTYDEKVCKKAFSALHGVSNKRIERLSSYMALTNLLKIQTRPCCCKAFKSLFSLDVIKKFRKFAFIKLSNLDSMIDLPQ
ncbi:hypothetical protein ABEB36_011336 [Hypothenemus hampei]|uniref:Uncharacterized protein n=1 Tax=Hypothenemus hampei TaxID=57062 RepID=A0ABD1EFP4_HYPHA